MKQMAIFVRGIAPRTLIAERMIAHTRSVIRIAAVRLEGGNQVRGWIVDDTGPVMQKVVAMPELSSGPILIGPVEINDMDRASLIARIDAVFSRDCHDAALQDDHLASLSEAIAASALG
ncbi:MAG TPA: hypothetical protein VHX68_11075 [Planctomycetaceae bacterium]|nr:hypothetical protein [Planctomycetaceae bacterium]